MRAAVVERYGPPEVAQIREVTTPHPKPREVLVRIAATTVSSGDARIRAAHFPKGFGSLARLAIGVRRPRRPILGVCLSGTVEAVGADVTTLAPGDEVCGMTGARFGTHAEYATIAAAKLVTKPAAVSHEDAAGVLFGGSTARQLLRGVQPGQSVLVVGASGAVGTNAVQLATIAGATVTGVTSTPNLDLVRELGADHVIDYRNTDLTTVSDRFDIVFDTVGALTPATGKPLLSDGGMLILAVASLWETITAHGQVKAGVAAEDPEDFAALLDHLARGELRVVVDDTLGLDDIAAAYARVDSERKVGNLILRP